MDNDKLLVTTMFFVMFFGSLCGSYLGYALQPNVKVSVNMCEK